MNTNSNLYIFIYSSVLVIIVATVLSFTAISLQPRQEKNIRIEKMQNILTSVGIENTFENAENLFSKYITQRCIINSNGELLNKKTNNEKIKGEDGFNVDLKIEIKKQQKDMKLPLFICTLNDGTKKIIIPVRGKGLWGPLWGYIALDDDYNTIYGAIFDHKSETPGLGAEINQSWFQEPFKNKKLFDKNKKFISINVHKGGIGSAKRAGDIDHGVDAISGGTITSKGLEKMLQDCLINYQSYLLKNMK
ncbi:MAG: NADH:ubiquinone reductase (Na(+)-transporting) subunit C [Bacteroidales bacterium]|nr:NADH:ubiquinone reductase (Na(+)-transporting) subunit C [Bacteroidales bacterium]